MSINFDIVAASIQRMRVKINIEKEFMLIIKSPEVRNVILMIRFAISSAKYQVAKLL